MQSERRRLLMFQRLARQYVFILVLLISSLILRQCNTDDIYQKVLDDLQFDDPRDPSTHRVNRVTQEKEKESVIKEVDDPSKKQEQEQLIECTSKLALAETEKADCLAKQKPQGSPLFKQLLRKISEVLQPSSRDINLLGARIVLRKEQLEELQSVLEKQPNPKDALDLLFQYNAFQALEDEPSVWREWLIRLNLPRVILSCSAIPLSFFFLKLLKQLFLNEFHWKRSLVFIIFIAFLCSIPWEWYRLYQVEFSKKASRLMKDFPPECNPDKDITTLQSISLFFRHHFSFENDVCAKYHEHIHVDPFWEVSPVSAISISLSRFFLQPMELFAEKLGVSFRLFFKEIPAQWQPFLFLGMLFLLCLLILSCSGLRIETPLLKITTNNQREVRYVQPPQPAGYVKQEEPNKPQLLTNSELFSIRQAIENGGFGDIPSPKTVSAENTGIIEVPFEEPPSQLYHHFNNQQAVTTAPKIIQKANKEGKNQGKITSRDVEHHNVQTQVKNVVLPSESEEGSSAVEEVEDAPTAQCADDDPTSTVLTSDGHTTDLVTPLPSVILRRICVDESSSSILVPDDSSVFSMPLTAGQFLRQRVNHSNGSIVNPSKSSKSEVENDAPGIS